MNLKRLGIAAAILATLGFSCHNEPEYERVGMSNNPTGSGWGNVPLASGSAPAGTAAAAPSASARPDSSKGAAKKRP